MIRSPFTIQTYFPNGDTLGYKISQIPTRTIQAIFIPRNELEDAIEDRSELAYNGIYFLFEDDKAKSNNELPKAYIGESENIATRLKDHHKNRKDWSTAIVFTTTGAENQLTKADIKYLENYCYQKALEAERFNLDQNTPTKSFVHESREADLMDMYKSITDLLTFLGFPLFLPITSETEIKHKEIIYLISNRGSDARAIYSQDGMTVLKASKTAPTQTNSFQNKELYQELIESRVIDKDGIFLKDYTFTKPSTAAGIVTRSSVNGWIVWKDKDGKTLEDNVRRK